MSLKRECEPSETVYGLTSTPCCRLTPLCTAQAGSRAAGVDPGGLSFSDDNNFQGAGDDRGPGLRLVLGRRRRGAELHHRQVDFPVVKGARLRARAGGDGLSQTVAVGRVLV